MADQGCAGAGLIRDQARAVAAAAAPLGNSPAGARLVVTAMDEHLAAMQRQLDAATEQNKVLAMRLRQLAEAYRGAGVGMGGWSPMAAIGALTAGRRRRRWRAGRSERACLATGVTDEPANRRWLIGVEFRGVRREFAGAAGTSRGCLALSDVSFCG